MTEKEKLALIYRITSGYTIIGKYVIDTPSEALLNESLDIYHQELKSNKFEGLLTADKTDVVLMHFKMWKLDSNKNLEELDKSLENAKVDLYNNFSMPGSQIKKIRGQIAAIRKLKNQQLNIKHSLDRFTLEGYADYSAEMHIFSRVVLDKDYKQVQLNGQELENLIHQYKRMWPSQEELRLVARTDPWRSLWNSKSDCFRIYGDEQKMLSLFSKMYDSVYDSSERPVEAVIQDDDMLDGWFLTMKRKNEQERKETTKNVVTQRHPHAQEIFIMTNHDSDTPIEEQVREINDMNDARGRIAQKQIVELIKHKDVVKDSDVPILKLEGR